jgi:hypothetical protein
MQQKHIGYRGKYRGRDLAAPPESNKKTARLLSPFCVCSTSCSQSEPFAEEALPQFLHSIAYPQREQHLSCLT